MSVSFEYQLTAPETAVDANNHVNNVEYIRWMQEAAVGHSEIVGGTRAAREVGATWFVKTHHIEYFQPAFAGEEILVLTWVADLRKSSSLRKYKIFRAEDQTLLAEAETLWVFVNAATGRPQPIPEQVRNAFEIVPPEDEP